MDPLVKCMASLVWINFTYFGFGSTILVYNKCSVIKCSKYVIHDLSFRKDFI